MPEGLTSFASQWCFFLILQPLLGHIEGGKTGECQLRGMGRGFKACEGWALLGTQWCQLRTRSPVAQVGWGNSGRVEERGWLPRSLPSRSNFTSLAALMPSSLRFFSIALLRSRAALSSALRVHPMVAPSLPQPARLGWHDSPGRRAPHPPKEQSLGSKGRKSRYPLLGWEQNC